MRGYPHRRKKKKVIAKKKKGRKRIPLKKSPAGQKGEKRKKTISPAIAR